MSHMQLARPTKPIKAALLVAPKGVLLVHIGIRYQTFVKRASEITEYPHLLFVNNISHEIVFGIDII